MIIWIPSHNAIGLTSASEKMGLNLHANSRQREFSVWKLFTLMSCSSTVKSALMLRSFFSSDWDTGNWCWKLQASYLLRILQMNIPDMSPAYLRQAIITYLSCELMMAHSDDAARPDCNASGKGLERPWRGADWNCLSEDTARIFLSTAKGMISVVMKLLALVLVDDSMLRSVCVLVRWLFVRQITSAQRLLRQGDFRVP